MQTRPHTSDYDNGQEDCGKWRQADAEQDDPHVKVFSDQSVVLTKRDQVRAFGVEVAPVGFIYTELFFVLLRGFLIFEHAVGWFARLEFLVALRPRRVPPHFSVPLSAIRGDESFMLHFEATFSITAFLILIL